MMMKAAYRVLVTLLLFLAGRVLSQAPYENWELVNNGKLVVSSVEDHSSKLDIANPCVVEIPSWATQVADPSAKFYLYFGEHHGNDVRMKWAPTIEGPWTSFNSSNTSFGVMDFRADSFRTVRKKGPENWWHVAAPSVILDHVNQVFVMAFHGKVVSDDLILSNGNRYRYRHTNFVAFSKDGLNFNDPETGGGQPGMWGPPGYELPYGPLEQHFVNTNKGNISVTTQVTASYARFIKIRGRLFFFHSLGIIARPTNSSSPWHFPSMDAYESDSWLWEFQTESDALWNSGDAEIERYKSDFGQDFQYTSHIATWFASSRFLTHPNNPSKDLPSGPYTVSTAKKSAKVNHLEVYPLDEDTIEVFIYIRADTNLVYPVDDPFNSLMRIEMNVSSDDWRDWSVAQRDGLDILDVVFTPKQVRDAVVDALNGTAVDPTEYADPSSLGVPAIFETEGSKYCFLGFKSLALQPDFNHSEGQIMAVKLSSPADDMPMALSFEALPHSFVPGEAFDIVVSAIDNDVVRFVRLVIDGVFTERIANNGFDDLYSSNATFDDDKNHRIGVRARDYDGNLYTVKEKMLFPIIDGNILAFVGLDYNAVFPVNETFQVLVQAEDSTAQINFVEAIYHEVVVDAPVFKTICTPNDNGFYACNVTLSTAGVFKIRARYNAGMSGDAKKDVRTSFIKIIAE